MNMINKHICLLIFYLKTFSCVSLRTRRLGNQPVDETLRFAAFGTSITYGSRLGNARKGRYLSLLSPNGTNLAMRGSDPSFPSICTQSMIGDDIYDVIVVEYHKAYFKGLNVLVKRLRQRFVDATIVVVSEWGIGNINVVDEKNEVKTPLIEWLAKNGLKENTPEARAFLEKSDVKFEFDTDANSMKERYMNKLEHDYNAKILSSHNQVANVKGLLLRLMPYHAEDWIHWSKLGHQFAAVAILNIVKAEKTKRSDRVGTWGEGDKCMKWLNEGKMEGNVITNGIMKQFDYRLGGKFALEFISGNGFINIDNPFSGPRDLALTYMTTGPAPSIYPMTRVSIKNSAQESTILDPTDTFYNYPVHVQHTLVIGKVNPGMNTVLITPIEKREKPFRLVGYAIANEIKIPKLWSRSFDTSTEK